MPKILSEEGDTCSASPACGIRVDTQPFYPAPKAWGLCPHGSAQRGIASTVLLPRLEMFVRIKSGEPLSNFHLLEND